MRGEEGRKREGGKRKGGVGRGLARFEKNSGYGPGRMRVVTARVFCIAVCSLPLNRFVHVDKNMAEYKTVGH